MEIYLGREGKAASMKKAPNHSTESTTDDRYAAFLTLPAYGYVD